MPLSFLHKQSRLFEWMTASMMIGIAVVILLNPSTIEVGGFFFMRNIGLSATVLVSLFLLAGLTRFCALVLNGLSPIWGPRLRAICAAVAAILWGQMALALWAWSDLQGYLSIGVPIYLFLSFGEVLTCHRAAHDGSPHVSA